MMETVKSVSQDLPVDIGTQYEIDAVGPKKIGVH